MGKNSAEYMRAYRARKKGEHAAYDADKPLIGQLKTELGEARRFTTEYATLANDRLREIEQLQEEVRHLKAELANRPPDGITVAQAERLGRKAQQAERDAILRKINQGG